MLCNERVRRVAREAFFEASQAHSELARVQQPSRDGLNDVITCVCTLEHEARGKLPVAAGGGVAVAAAATCETVVVGKACGEEWHACICFSSGNGENNSCQGWQYVHIIMAAYGAIVCVTLFNCCSRYRRPLSYSQS